MKFVIYQEIERWFWELRSDDTVFAVSSSGFQTYSEAADAIQRFKSACNPPVFNRDGPVLDHDEASNDPRESRSRSCS